MRPLWIVLALALAAGYTPAVQPARPVSLPLDGYRFSPAEAGRVARAHRVLVAECLAPFGLSVPEPTAAPDSAVRLNERRYGVTNPQHAGSAGYRLPGAPAARQSKPPAAPPPSASAALLPGQAGPAPDPDLLPVLSGRGERVIRGRPVPEGGCHAEARRRLNAHVPHVPDMFLAHRLDVESHRVSKADTDVRAAWARWSGCMRAKGYDYTDPLHAAADPAFRGPVSAHEIATALADIECKERTRLVAAWSAVEARWQRAAIAKHRAELEAVRRALGGQLTEAGRLGL